MSHQPDDPDDSVQRISTSLQHTALAHPTRQRLLFALSGGPSTISRLAARLGVNKGSVSHHLGALREAGLIQEAGTRQVRGGTEKYYRRTAERLVVAQPRAEGTAALFGAVAQELERSPVGHLLTLRHIRLGPAKAAELAKALAELVDGAEEEPDGEPVHGLLVTLYQQAGT
ncbi:ArsR/SmtB family transcription factor [Kitasatospora purpeofusca]|uniref:ArsR/SmtB family transcription factor n=1 Tax=Kitasatospora purpeofusca TaxID=67352 RepID=UPI000B049E48|nr:winged helix-turn-helix domain-containing protein [Kitasatospora purpeofusca]MCX4759127.1 winged helix-turn-helix domain-containing protein [Kitasatospora purpeofusca]WSR30464.1 winged helix-turn-helix domain-containing protein [Kitasatospora purpeofusca]WSR38703.1 winged helix-turn-helix domain-containing protein [Kitasatospora purpeofusca]